MSQRKTPGNPPDASQRIGVAETHPSLAKLHQRAAELGWRCLSQEWAGYTARYNFECANGHRFERHAATVFYHQPGCPGCEADEIRERWMASVTQRGGTLVSGAFTGLLERYRLRCANGHEWEAQGRKISEGSWCPQCSRAAAGQRSRSADGLERLKAAACAKGGRCLALRYVGTTGEYECECGEGHRWKTTGSHLLAGHWCAQCAAQQRGASLRTADGLDRLQATAEARGGACLTNAYTGRLKQYRFRCARGHEWETEGGVVLNVSWCKRCADDQQRSTLEQMQEVALSRGGRCLSVEYQNSNAKLTWECHRGHVWDAAPSSVLQGSWCMNCWRLGISKRGVKRKRYDIDG
ncbi:MULTISPECIES: hypothetical protein [unclassified Caballeronia]|uniref:hypothetical protein n=1 Tax=unclassified Caballeronia TaxID=2646786 RepID=UPI001F1A23A7|nr:MULTISPECIES: hypothetical protein [unclassified Caballeronia]MCE4545103.1 hypothetical protein [Caballeronia sp. PC1]MCE4570528.1 hypothetical protein [Caballeronia sp. CLC5]